MRNKNILYFTKLVFLLAFMASNLTYAQSITNVKDMILPEYFGVLGEDGQRLRIHISSIKRIDDLTYEIKGKSNVKLNTCNFSGEIKFEYPSNIQQKVSSQTEEEQLFNIDGEFRAKYIFKEDPKQNGTGIFEGDLILKWQYSEDNNSEIKLADLWYTMRTCAIQFDGTWTSYRTKKSKKACWGDYTCCYPEDFNVSDGPDIIPNEKYRSKGWGDLIDYYSPDDNVRKKVEKKVFEKWY